jgi:glycine/D-amino acid oxidase-like deaminating enzyme
MTVSFWLDHAGDRTARPALDGDRDVDVAVVGAGYTGLWTAYYLRRADPSLRIAVLEANFAGFGASGRNGGWCSALFPTSLATLAAKHGRDAAIAMQRAMEDSVNEVGRVAAEEAIDCDYHRGGTVILARSRVQLERARAEVAEAASFGVELDLLTPDEARKRCGATDVLGGTYTPHCAAIQPARLVRGLAARTPELFEQTPVRSLSLGGRRPRAITAHGTVTADVVVRATEGYTATLPGFRRAIAPVYSLMIATEPLPASAWESIGLADRETFADGRHLIIYGQRTADDRLAFGGRGAPYHYASSIRPTYDREPRVFADLARVLAELFPVLGEVRIAQAWGGPLGIARDWHPSVGYDRARGYAWAGGYVGDGVSTSNLAGRTLAALITGQASPLIELPWVNHRSPNWEPEPLRWLGINAGLRVMSGADAGEMRSGRPSRRAALFSRIMGR